MFAKKDMLTLLSHILERNIIHVVYKIHIYKDLSNGFYLFQNKAGFCCEILECASMC